MSSFSKSKNLIDKKTLGYSSVGSIFFSFFMAAKMKWLLKSTAVRKFGCEEIQYLSLSSLRLIFPVNDLLLNIPYLPPFLSFPISIVHLFLRDLLGCQMV